MACFSSPPIPSGPRPPLANPLHPRSSITPMILDALRTKVGYRLFKGRAEAIAVGHVCRQSERVNSVPLRETEGTGVSRTLAGGVTPGTHTDSHAGGALEDQGRRGRRP